MTARALSIQQPWAWAITDLDKRVENRSKPPKFRGEVFLHASLQERPVKDLADCVTPIELNRAQVFHDSGQMPLGAIVAVATLESCTHPADWLLTKQQRWAEGPYCYVLADVVKLPEPVPCKGALGFWKVPPDVEAKVRRQLEMGKKKGDTETRGRGDTRTSEDPKPNSPEDLGYGAGEKRLSPDQQRAIIDTEIELGLARSELALAVEAHTASIEAAKEAKKKRDGKDRIVESLRDRLEDIAAGRPCADLPGMGPGEGSSATGESKPATEEIPEDLYSDALKHVETCRAKGKGLDVASLSLVLFSNRKKEHKPRCQQILDRLAAEGHIVADESDDDKPRWLPAGKE